MTIEHTSGLLKVCSSLPEDLSRSLSVESSVLISIASLFLVGVTEVTGSALSVFRRRV